jgi:hypothetical protein
VFISVGQLSKLNIFALGSRVNVFRADYTLTPLLHSTSLPGLTNRIMSALVPASAARAMMATMIERTLLPQRAG